MANLMVMDELYIYERITKMVLLLQTYRDWKYPSTKFEPDIYKAFQGVDQDGEVFYLVRGKDQDGNKQLYALPAIYFLEIDPKELADIDF